MNISDRLERYRRKCGLTWEKLGEQLDLSRTMIHYLRTGERPPSPWVEKRFQELEDEAGLLTHHVDPVPITHPAGRKSGTAKLVPIISWASAGSAHAYEDQGYDVPMIASTCSDPNCYALSVEGDSMEHLYTEGDVVIALTKDEPRNGDLVIAKLMDDTVYFKELRFTPDGKGVRLFSFNPKYPVMDHKRKDFRFIHPVHSVTRVFKKNFGWTVHREQLEE